MTPQHKPQHEEEKPTTSTTLIARKVTPAALSECGARLRAGDLLAFPTETVYGLGCHALDPSAVQKVFAAKERPLTDPLIVHVAQAEDALPLWNHQEEESEMFPILQSLCDRFWPGPLTLVAKAAPQVPAVLMANTGYVACRCPLHPLAQELIREAKVPIAAPSANKFGHVSPTQADHVMDDLGQEDVWVLEDKTECESKTTTTTTAAAIACQVGVESTVAKLEAISDSTSTSTGTPHFKYALTVLRQGAISVQDLQECLTKAARTDVSVASLSSRTVEETQATVAPGQTIKHYSPRIPSFLLAPSLLSNPTTNNKEGKLTEFLQRSIVLDFGGRMGAWKSSAKQYRDLSAAGDSSQAAQCVFEALRWAERIDAEAQYIVFPQVVQAGEGSNKEAHDALTLALHDRLTRAASGVVLDSLSSIDEQTQPLQP